MPISTAQWFGKSFGKSVVQQSVRHGWNSLTKNLPNAGIVFNLSSMVPIMSHPLSNNPLPALPLSPGASAPAQTAVNAFNRSVSSAPPAYAESKITTPDSDCPAPPAYVPVDCSALFNALPTDHEKATYGQCVDRLTVAYRFNIEALAKKMCTPNIARMHQPLEMVLFKLLSAANPVQKNPMLSQLAERLRPVFNNCWRDMKCLEDKNQMVLVICLYFLEQKAQILTANSKDELTTADAGFVPNQASLVRKELFQLIDRLNKSDNVGLGLVQLKLKEFLAGDDMAELREDLECEVPISQGLELSQLRYEQIPGTTVCPELRQKINSYNEIYGINFYDLIEAIGDIYALSRFPIQKYTHELLLKNDPKIRLHPVKKELHFMDRNARFVIAAMDHFHKSVFDAPDKWTDEKRSLPVPAPAVCVQKKTEVMQNFMHYFLGKLAKDSINSVHKKLTRFISQHWPTNYVPARCESPLE